MVDRGTLVTANGTPGVWRVAATRRTPHGVALLLLPTCADSYLYLVTSVDPGIRGMLRVEEDVLALPRVEDGARD